MTCLYQLSSLSIPVIRPRLPFWLIIIVISQSEYRLSPLISTIPSFTICLPDITTRPGMSSWTPWLFRLISISVEGVLSTLSISVGS